MDDVCNQSRSGNSDKSGNSVLSKVDDHRPVADTLYITGSGSASHHSLTRQGDDPRRKLRVRKGEFSGTPGKQVRDRSARYYMVRASNSRRRFRTAHEVQLMITRIEKEIERQVGTNVRETLFDEIMPLS
jgi:hypothetical protein